jgi:hypothetical protein
MAIQFGTSQINKPAPRALMIVANTVIIGSGLIALLIAPMPNKWIPMDVRNYMLTVAAGSGGFLKVIEKLTGTTPDAPIDSPTPPTAP